LRCMWHRPAGYRTAPESEFEQSSLQGCGEKDNL
jgi:hypothetical protein